MQIVVRWLHYLLMRRFVTNMERAVFIAAVSLNMMLICRLAVDRWFSTNWL